MARSANQKIKILYLMKILLEHTDDHGLTLEEISNAYNSEDRINNMRNNLRDAEIEELENEGKSYQTSVYYMDIVNELERMGDFMINVSQDLERAFIQK